MVDNNRVNNDQQIEMVYGIVYIKGKDSSKDRVLMEKVV